MAVTGKELKQIIENNVRKNLMEYFLNERDVIKIPSPPMGDVQPVEEAPPEDDAMPPEEGMGGGGEEDMEEIPPEGEDGDMPPELEGLMQLLQANPQRIEGIYNYAKGIIGNDNEVPEEGGGTEDMEEMPPEEGSEEGQPAPMPEGKIRKLDELVDDILNVSGKPSKPTITTDNHPQHITLKGKMFRPVM
jgi:hypothetical protein